MRTWRELGVEPRLFVLDDEAAGEERRAGDVVAVPLRMPGRHAELRRQITARDLATAVLDWEPDIAYTRPFLFAPAMDRLFRRIPTVCEINTDDTVEFPGYASRMMRLHNPTRHLTMRRMDGFVFVTHELRENARLARYDVPSVVIGNGIDVDAVPRHPAPSNARPRILFLVGSSSEWTGIDRFAALASALPEFDFDLAGSVRDPVAMPPNIRCHGYVVGAELEALLQRADVGLGTLALYRKSMDEACTLKVRECLSRGIPMILPYRDTDVPPASSGVLSLPNSPDALTANIARIRDFIRTQVGRRVSESLIRRIDSSAKELRRLDFFGQVASRSTRPPISGAVRPRRYDRPR